MRPYLSPSMYWGRTSAGPELCCDVDRASPREEHTTHPKAIQGPPYGQLHLAQAVFSTEDTLGKRPHMCAEHSLKRRHKPLGGTCWQLLVGNDISRWKISHGSAARLPCRFTLQPLRHAAQKRTDRGICCIPGRYIWTAV